MEKNRVSPCLSLYTLYAVIFELRKLESQNLYFIFFLSSGSFKIIYVTPERLAKSKRFMNALQKCYLAKRLHLIAVDEG